MSEHEFVYRSTHKIPPLRADVECVIPDVYPPWVLQGKRRKLSPQRVRKNCEIAFKTFFDANLAFNKSDDYISRDILLLSVIGFLVYNHHIGSIPGKPSFHFDVRLPLDMLGERWGFDVSGYKPNREDYHVKVNEGEGAMLFDLVQARHCGGQSLLHWEKADNGWHPFWGVSINREMWASDRPAYVLADFDATFCQIFPYGVEYLAKVLGSELAECVEFCERWYRKDFSVGNCEGDDTIYKYIETGKFPEGYYPPRWL